MLALTAVAAAGTVLSFVPTKLPAASMENARVIVAPCSPLMAAQQQWAWPGDNNNHAPPLTLTASVVRSHAAVQVKVKVVCVILVVILVCV